MSHWDAMGKCIGKDGEDIADELNLEYSTIRRWTRPYDGPKDSGSRGPGEVLFKVVRKARELGRKPEDAFAPLDEIETLLGRVCIEIVPTNKTVRELAIELGKTMKESGEAIAVASKDLSDGKLTAKEKADVLRESREALRQWATLIIAFERS